MCIAVSGEIRSIENNIARVNVRGNIINAHIGLISPKVGDFVLVHAGCALQILSRSEALSMDDLFDEIQRAAYEND